LLARRDPQPGFPILWQFPFEMEAQEIEPIGDMRDMGFLQ